MKVEHDTKHTKQFNPVYLPIPSNGFSPPAHGHFLQFAWQDLKVRNLYISAFLKQPALHLVTEANSLDTRQVIIDTSSRLKARRNVFIFFIVSLYEAEEKHKQL